MLVYLQHLTHARPHWSCFGSATLLDTCIHNFSRGKSWPFRPGSCYRAWREPVQMWSAGKSNLGGGGMSFQRVRVQGGLGRLDIFHFIYYVNMKILMCIAKSDKHFSSVAESKLFIFDSCSRFFFILVPFWLRLQSYVASLKCTISNNTYKKNLGLHLYLW